MEHMDMKRMVSSGLRSKQEWVLTNKHADGRKTSDFSSKNGNLNNYHWAGLRKTHKKLGLIIVLQIKIKWGGPTSS